MVQLSKLWFNRSVTNQEVAMSVVDISALVQYNNWANRRLLDTAAHLSADQLIGMVFHQVRAFAR
jgi:uncharacterized damage-inducible protein DinB